MSHHHSTDHNWFITLVIGFVSEKQVAYPMDEFTLVINYGESDLIRQNIEF